MISSDVRAGFQAALSGPTYRVVRLGHPWLRTFAANIKGSPALIFKVPFDKSFHAPKDGRGFTVTAEVNGDESELRIVSRSQGLSLMFEKLIEYVLERTAARPDQGVPSDAIIAALEEFRNFFQPPRGRLDESEVRGFFAELRFLLDLRQTRGLSPLELMGAWGGPFGALHDFRLSDETEIEVKSSHRPPTKVRVSSASQLRPTGGKLRLAILPIERVAPESDSGTRLLDLVAEMRSVATAAGGDVLDAWEAALSAIGLDASDPYYEQWAFVTGEWLAFEVREGFPCITDDAIPKGVTDVSYSLDLSAIGEFRIENFLDEGAR